MEEFHAKISKLLYRLAEILEALVAIVLVVAICASIVFIVQQTGLLWKAGGDTHMLHDFLGTAFTVVIGIEFLEMLCRHNMRSVIEVILFAIAKTMVVEHAGAFETLLMVIALAILFLVRKYLFIPVLDDPDSGHGHKA